MVMSLGQIPLSGLFRKSRASFPSVMNFILLANLALRNWWRSSSRSSALSSPRRAVPHGLGQSKDIALQRLKNPGTKHLATTMRPAIPSPPRGYECLVQDAPCSLTEEWPGGATLAAKQPVLRLNGAARPYPSFDRFHCAGMDDNGSPGALPLGGASLEAETRTSGFPIPNLADAQGHRKMRLSAEKVSFFTSGHWHAFRV